MHEQRSDTIDLEARRRRRERATAHRIYFETMRLRCRLPDLPGYGQPAACLTESGGEFVLLVSHELDEIDVKIAAYRFATKFARFDRADATRLSLIREVRSILEDEARRFRRELGEWVDFQLLGRVS